MFAVVAAMAVVVVLSLVVTFFVAFPSRNRRLPGTSGRVGDAMGRAVGGLPTLTDGDEFLSRSR